MNNNLIHEELSKSIIGASMDVLNELKPGLDEKLYENAQLKWKRIVRKKQIRTHPRNPRS